MVQSLNEVASFVAIAVGQQVGAGDEIDGVLAAAVNKTDDLVCASGHIRRSADQSNIAAADVRSSVERLQKHFRQLRSDAELFVGHIKDA